MTKPKPKIRYNIGTGRWECCEGKLCNLGEGETPQDAYTMWDIHYIFNRGQTKQAKIMADYFINNTYNLNPDDMFIKRESLLQWYECVEGSDGK